jgi:Trypsin-co-occurring domain 2
MTGDLELAVAVATVRAELAKAAAAAQDEEIQFEVGEVTMEFAVEIRADASAKAGFTAWVITVGGEAGTGRTNSHRVTVSLNPHYANGERVNVSDEDMGGTDLFGNRAGS